MGAWRGLSQRRVGFHLCGPGNQSGARLRHWLEHGDGLHAESDDLHHLDQPASTRVCPWRRLLGLGDLLRGVFTWLNIQGLKTSARMNAGLAAGMGVVIALFFVAAARYIFGHPAGSRILHPAFLRSANLEYQSGVGRHFRRGAYLHRLRWHFDTFRGGREPTPQHPAGHGAHLRGDWYSFRAGSLCGAAGLAGTEAFPEH